VTSVALGMPSVACGWVASIPGSRTRRAHLRPARNCFAPPVRSSSSRRAPVHDFRGISKSMLLPWTTLGRVRPACGPPLRDSASRCFPVHDDRGISKSMLFPWITSGDLRPGCGHDFPCVCERPSGHDVRLSSSVLRAPHAVLPEVLISLAARASGDHFRPDWGKTLGYDAKNRGG
jgi:hypothetical protein